MTRIWSLEEYCSKQAHLLNDSENGVPTTSAGDDYWSSFLGKNDLEANRKFFLDLELPTVHPFCLDSGEIFEFDASIPPMGSLNLLGEIWSAGHSNESATRMESFVTLWYMVAPALLAMAELWLRLFAGLIGPIGIAYLAVSPPLKATKRTSFAIVLTVGSSLILMTDTLYVLHNGPSYGATLFLASVIVCTRLCWKHNLRLASVIVALLVILSAHLVHFHDGELVFGSPVDEVKLEEGLYFDSKNTLVSRIVERWSENYRVYDVEHGATTWMPTGDSRTGLPFMIHKFHPDQYPSWNRVFLKVQDDRDPVSEYVSLDVSFPKTTGHDSRKPIYFVLHGLSGGSQEEYIRDLTIRRNAEGSTVVVMIARGMMDTPIRGFRFFNGARTSDAHEAASVLRRVLGSEQVLVGAGYSMGGIIISNYVATYGSDCALDAAVAVSGGLDMRYQEDAFRTQRLWQPMLAGTLRDEFLLGKFGHRVKEKLTTIEYLKVLRSSHITEIDRYAVVPLNGFDDLDHYYREMSALGDIPHNPVTDLLEDTNKTSKIHSIAIPFLVVHAFDDPLITWRTTIQNTGFMHPANLTKSGSGYLMMLLTKAGGHVGWPLGLWPTENKWKWMSDVVMSFAQSVHESKMEGKELS